MTNNSKAKVNNNNGGLRHNKRGSHLIAPRFHNGTTGRFIYTRSVFITGRKHGINLRTNYKRITIYQGTELRDHGANRNLPDNDA